MSWRQLTVAGLMTLQATAAGCAHRREPDGPLGGRPVSDSVPTTAQLSLLGGLELLRVANVADTFPTLLVRAEERDPVALLLVAMGYAYGTGVERDVDEGRRRLLLLAEGDAARTSAPQFGVARARAFYQLGVGPVFPGLSETDPEHLWEAQAAWQLKALDGGIHIAAETFYFMPIPVRGKPAHDRSWLELAANRGVPSAQLTIAKEFEHGRKDHFPWQTMETDPKQALAWRRKAAANGDLESQLTLGWAYASGEEVPLGYVLLRVKQSNREALDWYLRASDQDDVIGLTSAAELIRTGSGTAADPARAFSLYKRASDLARPVMKQRFPDGTVGWDESPQSAPYALRRKYNKHLPPTDLERRAVALAAANMARAYESGIGTAKDPALALDAYIKAAAWGNADANYWMARRRRASKDERSARRYMTRALELGHPGAALERGMEALDRKEYKSARAHLTIAADHGHVLAQYQVARLYDSGLGGPQSGKKAIRYYRLAAGQGHASSQNAIGNVYWRGKWGTPVDKRQAQVWYEKAAAQGHAVAQTNVAVALLKRNKIQAGLRFLRLAARQGEPAAIDMLPGWEAYAKRTGVRAALKSGASLLVDAAVAADAQLKYQEAQERALMEATIANMPPSSGGGSKPSIGAIQWEDTDSYPDSQPHPGGPNQAPDAEVYEKRSPADCTGDCNSVIRM